MRLALKVWFIFTHTHICFFFISLYKQERSHSWMCLCFQECVRQIYLQAIRDGLDDALNMNNQKVEGKYLTDSCLPLSLITLQSNLWYQDLEKKKCYHCDIQVYNTHFSLFSLLQINAFMFFIEYSVSFRNITLQNKIGCLNWFALLCKSNTHNLWC